MTCKDCYHYDVCHSRINSIDFLPVIKGKVSMSSIMYKECDDVEKHCLHFKDKSRIVELPCKVWDKVYYISIKAPLTHKIEEAEVLNYNINGYGIRTVKIRPLDSEYSFTTGIENIYTTKSKAEAKLKELLQE